MAKKMMDIALDASEDLDISAGDFFSVESTYEHQRQLLLNNKGDFKQNPTICVGAVNFIDDEGANDLVRIIAQEFMKDGMIANQLNPNPVSLIDSTVKPFEKAYYK